MDADRRRPRGRPGRPRPGPGDRRGRPLGGDLLLKAEGLLVEEAAKLGPQKLAVLGGRVLERLPPDIAEGAEYQRLLAAERRANATTELNLRSRGDGSTPGIPSRPAARLPRRLFTAPRRHHWAADIARQAVETRFRTADTAADEFDLPIERQRSIAFVAFLENTLSSDLPRHGGVATTLITIPTTTS